MSPRLRQGALGDSMADQIEEVRPLVGTQSERSGEGFDHRRRGPSPSALLQADHVVHAEAGQLGDLLAPKPDRPPVCAHREAELHRIQTLPSCPKEHREFADRVHVTNTYHESG